MTQQQQRTAWPYAMRDSSRTRAEGQHYAIVISGSDTDAEQDLHTTTWYASERLALTAAVRWMEDNGIALDPA